MVSSGISDIVTTSEFSEKTRMKKLMMMKTIIIIIMNKSQETTVFHGRRGPEIDFRYEIKARKVMVDFKFDALYS